jgi:hypothetical protein
MDDEQWTKKIMYQFIVYRLTFIVVPKRASFDKPVLSEPFTLRQAQGER